MKIVLMFFAVCFIALSCAAPVEDEHEREKRSSSHESYGRGQFLPPFIPYNPNINTNPNTNTNSLMNLLLPFLIARLAPATAPAAGK